MTLEWKIKRFQELSITELYYLLQLRSEVFVAEQNCVYQDIDGKDRKAWHLIGEYDSKIVAYARLFKAGDYFEEASIGRVVVEFVLFFLLDQKQSFYGVCCVLSKWWRGVLIYCC